MQEPMDFYVQAGNLANALAAMKLMKIDPIQRVETLYEKEGRLYSEETRKFVYGWGNLPSYSYVVFEFDKLPDDKTYRILSAFGYFWKAFSRANNESLV
jgi:hypothetical protein